MVPILTTMSIFMVGSTFILSVRGTQNLLDTKYSLYIYSAVVIHVTFILGAQQAKYIYICSH